MYINVIAVILAALSAFFLGFLWYTVVFGKIWQREIGMRKEGVSSKSTQQPPSLGKLLGGSFLLELVMAANLSAFLGSNAGWLIGLMAGVAVGFGWVSLAFGVNYLFEGKSFKLWLINAGYNTVVFAVMGVIIGAM